MWNIDWNVHQLEQQAYMQLVFDIISSMLTDKQTLCCMIKSMGHFIMKLFCDNGVGREWQGCIQNQQARWIHTWALEMYSFLLHRPNDLERQRKNTYLKGTFSLNRMIGFVILVLVVFSEDGYIYMFSIRSVLIGPASTSQFISLAMLPLKGAILFGN